MQEPVKATRKTPRPKDARQNQSFKAAKILWAACCTLVLVFLRRVVPV
jgi:hypothetical protein